MSVESADFPGSREFECFDLLERGNGGGRERAQLDRFGAMRAQRRRDRLDPFAPLVELSAEFRAGGAHERS